MAQPERGGNTPWSAPWSPRTDRAPSGTPADSAGETTQQIRRQGMSARTVATESEAVGGDEEFSAPRLSRAGSLSASQASAPMAATAVASGGDDRPTQSLPKVEAAGVSAPKRSVRASAPRRARLQVRHIGPWTVLKFSALLAIALFLVWLIAIGLLYGVLNGSGVIAKVNDTYTTISGAGSTPPVTTGLVFSGALVVGAVGAVVFVALSTIGAIIYNLCADVVGGVELTLAERE